MQKKKKKKKEKKEEKKKEKEKKKDGRKEKKRKDGILVGSWGLKPMLNKNCSFRRLGREGAE